MTKMWIVVADEAKARILSLEKLTEPLVEIQTFNSEEATKRDQDIVSDKSGTSYDSSGQGRHSMGDRNEQKEQYAIRFAKEISECLEKNRLLNSYTKVVIIAAPHFLGLLRKTFSKEVSEMISLEVDKDLTMKDNKIIREYLPQYL